MALLPTTQMCGRNPTLYNTRFVSSNKEDQEAIAGAGRGEDIHSAPRDGMMTLGRSCSPPTLTAFPRIYHENWQNISPVKN